MVLPAEERQRVRQVRALPLLADIRSWLDEHLPIVPPRSALGKAMNYAHKQWPKLIVFVEDGRLRIDNNLTENAIRPRHWLTHRLRCINAPLTYSAAITKKRCLAPSEFAGIARNGCRPNG